MQNLQQKLAIWQGPSKEYLRKGLGRDITDKDMNLAKKYTRDYDSSTGAFSRFTRNHPIATTLLPGMLLPGVGILPGLATTMYNRSEGKSQVLNRFAKHKK